MSIANDLIPYLIDFQERSILDIRKKHDVASFLKDLRQLELAQFVESTPDGEWASFIDENFGPRESVPAQIAILTEGEILVPEVHAKTLTPAIIYMKDAYNRAVKYMLRDYGDLPPPEDSEERAEGIVSGYKRYGAQEGVIVADHVSLMHNRSILRVGIGKGSETWVKASVGQRRAANHDPMFWDIKHSAPGLYKGDPHHTYLLVKDHFKHVITINMENIARIERR